MMIVGKDQREEAREGGKVARREQALLRVRPKASLNFF